MNKDRQKLLEEIMRIDPVIRKAEEKLRRLSSDPEVVKEYEKREKELAKIREYQIMDEIKSLEFDDEVYAEPSKYQIRVREMANYCRMEGKPISSLKKEEAMRFVERKGEK
ncbi:hypothetical protein V7124_19885 [Neobacillus niacini]|uniref:hypothetical protein n=1 Tax=Neobacillus niacini TaxID=86668 RepID=UPI002FFFDE58